VVGPWVWDVPRREIACRREFFYNAFKALRFNGIDGDYAEFGSWGAVTFGLAYHEVWRCGHPARLWAFDSFKGLPAPGADDEHPEWREGVMAISLEEFHAACARKGIPRDRYTVVPGYYDETLAAMAPEDEPRNIALACVDCDLYSSSKTVLEFPRPRLKHGMIVAFDDYFCWSATQAAGERRAMLELAAEEERWDWVPYVQYGWHGQSYLRRDRTPAVSRPARADRSETGYGVRRDGRRVRMIPRAGSGYSSGLADVAQLVEHFTRNEGVRGSNPRVGLSQGAALRQRKSPVSGAPSVLWACLGPVR
jgi:O-methyltransferase